MSETCNFQEPGTLKDILELLAKLYNASSLKDSVGQKLSEDVRKYCKDAQKFYGSHSGFLSTVFTNGSGIRSTILENSMTQYDKYKDLDRDHGSHKDCVKKISEALKECLPRGYVALYYLYFMCSTECSRMHGGQWSGQKVNGSGGSGQDLYKWFTQKHITPELITRGFSQGKLKESNDGQIVAPVIKTIIKHDSPGDFQNVLVFLLFSCPWDHSLLGHAICFLDKFCSKVSAEEGLQEKLKGYSGDLKTVCSTLKSHLQPFISGDSHLFAVCHNNSGLFDGIWDDEHFDKYCDWLRKNLNGIIQSLNTMSLESPGWDLSTIQSASSAGPFLYGFVYKASWKDSGYISKLQTDISKLTGEDSGSLGKLKSFLENPSSGSSPGATAAGAAGGILSLGGAGFGAAYGFNLFGLKDIMSGVFGAIRGLVVGF
ncbi:secreted antigen 1 [Babesia divergens]|uniref:Secreted antigen 1 n=1 Tax=Babesia divergens TaxID=32595 RepID=A0AAD9GIF0_BABDI|nr:secreted antigen 1 [Babesia divergens]